MSFISFKSFILPDTDGILMKQVILFKFTGNYLIAGNINWTKFARLLHKYIQKSPKIYSLGQNFHLPGLWGDQEILTLKLHTAED